MNKKTGVIIGLLICALSFFGMMALMLLGKMIPDIVFYLFVIGIFLTFVFSIFRRREFLIKQINSENDSNECLNKKSKIFASVFSLIVATIILLIISAIIH